ncbi:hypothetical protein IWQ60_009991 [Tieghemiomyces parasiticus]|uniref:Defective in cullin neddylation protein n=1 Tax=Tieghemiomyces parasiticus TaxID=78921 RepID=A0A9W7ZME2_9FUNG|nr:hypothetical protein IWQ60_009991 [Tieghemiomyces parasiticus]
MPECGFISTLFRISSSGLSAASFGTAKLELINIDPDIMPPIRKKTPLKEPAVASPASTAVGTKRTRKMGIDATSRKSGRAQRKTTAGTDPKQDALQTLYKKYEDPNDAQIGPEGIEAFCADIGISPESDDFLILAWKLNAATMGFFSEAEFTAGLRAQGCQGATDVQAKLPTWKAELDVDAHHKAYYLWLFRFTKDPTQKSLAMPTAAAVLPQVLKDNSHVEPFVRFLQTQSGVHVVNKDQWMSFYEFSLSTPVDCSGYDEMGAWPTLLDEYVAWRRGGEA